MNSERIATGGLSPGSGWTARVCPALVFMVAWPLYLWCLGPGVGWGDGADFVLCAHYLGVAHPTGYPLVTLAGKLASFIPAGALAFRMGLLFALAGALAAGLFFRLAAVLGRSRALAFYAALVLVLSTFLWKQSSNIEVYSLNLLFFVCLLSLSPIAPGGRGPRALIAMTGLAVFALGNHATLIFPAVVLALAGLAYNLRSWKKVISAGAFLVAAGFTLYLCLPLLSARTDILDWNRPDSPPGFYLLLSGWDFWVIGEYRLDVMWRNFIALAGSVAAQAWPVLIAGFLFAVFTGAVKRFARFVLLGILVLSSFFPIVYPTHEKEEFFLPAFACILLLGVAGIRGILKSTGPATARGIAVAVAVVALFNVGYLLARNSPELFSRRNDTSAREYSELLMKSARRDALVFIDHVADDTVAPPLYYQFADGMRRDVFVFHRLYLAFPWWRNYMGDRADALGDALVMPDIDLEQEKGRSYRISLEEYRRLSEGKTLNTVSIDLQTKRIIFANKDYRPVYINTPARFRKSVLSDGVPLALSGFLFRLGDGEGKEEFMPPAARGGVFDELLFDYYSERAMQFYRRGRTADFAFALEHALEYEKRSWVFGELCGAFQRLDHDSKAEKYCTEYRERKAVDDIYQP